MHTLLKKEDLLCPTCHVAHDLEKPCEDAIDGPYPSKEVPQAHHLNPTVPEDVAFAESRIRPETIAPAPVRTRFVRSSEPEEHRRYPKKWLSKPFFKLLRMRGWGSDRPEDIKVRLVIARRSVGPFGGADYHGVAIDVEFDFDRDLLKVEVNNTGQRGNHPNDHTHGLLQVADVMLGDPDTTVLHYPWSDCVVEKREPILDKLAEAAGSLNWSSVDDLKEKMRKILGWKK